MLFDKKRVVLLLIVLTLSLLVVACGQDSEETETENETEEGIAIGVVDAERKDIATYINTTARAEAKDSLYLMPQLQGEIEEVAVELGQEVVAGDKLLELDTELNELDLRQAEAGLNAAEAELERVLAGAREEDLEQLRINLAQAELRLEQVENDFERQEDLYEQDSISEQQFELAKLEYEGAQAEKRATELSLRAAEDGAREEEIRAVRANVEQARLGIEAARLQLEYGILEAPFAGIIANVNVAKGELAGGEPAFELVNLDQISLTTYYSEEYINDIEPGVEVLVDIPAIGEEFAAEVTNVGPSIDQQQGKYPVEIIIDNQDHLIKSGMYARIKTVNQQAKDSVVIPQIAVLNDNQQDYIMIHQDGVAIRKDVETGVTTGEEVEIISGINANVEVIIEGQERLETEDKVRVVNRGDQ